MDVLKAINIDYQPNAVPIRLGSETPFIKFFQNQYV